jgi:signal transduction histidine kinase
MTPIPPGGAKPAADAERWRREMMSRVAHELRTPLTAVRGALEMIAAGSGGGVAPEAAALLGVARRNADRLVRLVEDSLLLAELEGATYDLCTARVRPGAVVAPAVAQPHGASAPRGGRVEARVDTDAYIVADAPLLVRALDGLVARAIAAADGAIIVLSATLGPQGAVRFTVDVDRPAGGADPFRHGWRKDESGEDAAGAEALELRLARAVVERHGGRVGATTPGPGGATALWLELPAV